ncbi:hypothetical protein C7271_03615 [filamentous cyanobacterium CCP5]|nr:hypothetical protein C7271_03615 [filamentous cyanobacterium CCP5]
MYLTLKKPKSILRKIFSRSYASPSRVSKAELIFYANYVQEGMTVFDVGANVGRMSLIFSSLSGRNGKVYSFEPARENFQKLKQVCDLCGCKNISLRNLALSDQKKEQNLFVYEEEYSTLNSLVNRPLKEYGIDIEPIKEEIVSVDTVDDFCTDNGIENIDLLKIDVEGAEYQVLLGARKMLENKKIRCCLFEFGATTFDMGNHPGEIESYLKHLNYRLENIISSDPVFPGRSSAQKAAFSLMIAKPRS